MNKRIIKTIGMIAKEETFISAERLSDCQFRILESVQPFPGYHGKNLPGQENADSYYLLTKKRYNDDKIIRSIMDVKKDIQINFNGTPGTITIQNQIFNLIRIKDVMFERLPEIIQHIKTSGIEFQKKKKQNQVTALLKIRKFFSMKESVEGIFQDINKKEFSYLQLDDTMHWNAFKSITQKIKYNVDDNNYDAALGHIYCENGLMDFVRIFDRNFKLGKLIYIRKKYLEYQNKV